MALEMLDSCPIGTNLPISVGALRDKAPMICRIARGSERPFSLSGIAILQVGISPSLSLSRKLGFTKGQREGLPKSRISDQSWITPVISTVLCP